MELLWELRLYSWITGHEVPAVIADDEDGGNSLKTADVTLLKTTRGLEPVSNHLCRGLLVRNVKLYLLRFY